MNKYYEILNRYFYSEDVLDLFEKQIMLYEQEKNRDLECNQKYKIGDEIILSSNTLIHGSRININDLRLIKQNGIISPEFYKEVNLNKKKPWVAEFWKINEDIGLFDYIKKYCGCTIEVKNRNGDTIKNIISAFKDVEFNIMSLKNIEYRDYLIYQNMEQRFLPNDYTNNSTMAFILSPKNENHKMLTKINVLDRNWNINIQRQLFPQWFIEKYFETKIYDNNETDRGIAYLFGLPSNMIEGILVNRKIENNNEDISKIKAIFPNCYICNIDGKVIG